MKKTLWVFCLTTLLSLVVTSSVWAGFTLPYYRCDDTLKLSLKLPEGKQGNIIIHSKPMPMAGTLVLGTTAGSDTLNYNPLGTANNKGPCFMVFMEQPNHNFLICIYDAAFIPTKNTKAEGGGKKHSEKASFYGFGEFYIGDSGLNPDGVWGYVSILCNTIKFQEDVHDDVTEIDTGACNISGGLPDLTNISAGELGPGWTFTGTINCKMAPVSSVVF